MKRVALVLASILACGSAAGASPIPMPVRYSLVHHTVSTSNEVAQAAFDEGLTLLYAYNRIAARSAFERAALADPKLAMAQWGVAQSWGANINVSIDASGEKSAYEAVQSARALESGASDEERAYIEALASRYSNAAHPDFKALALAYKRAMGDLMKRYPDDLDAATLYAESEMELHPWQWFTPSGQPAEGTNDIISTLESVMMRDPMHIGANHLYIHATEESQHPERALLSAGRLGTFTFEPAAAHLVHMPAHTYMRTGFYDLAVETNLHATEHDRAYMANESDIEGSAYYAHNLMFLASAYQMEGNYAGAKAAGAVLEQEGAVIPALFVLCRFNRWAEIQAYHEPKADPNEPLRLGIWHFARGLADAGTGDLAGAARERRVLADMNRALDVPTLAGSNNGSRVMFGLATDVLDARVALARNQTAAAVKLFQHAVATQDSLAYVEPPDWYYPVRESLGAALLRSGDAKASEHVFRDDLSRNPRSGRSLFGLAESLKAQGDVSDAAWVRRSFDEAWQHADTQISLNDL